MKISNLLRIFKFKIILQKDKKWQKRGNKKNCLLLGIFFSLISSKAFILSFSDTEFIFQDILEPCETSNENNEYENNNTNKSLVAERQ